MTTKNLHKILDNKDKKISLDELEQVIYDMKQDCFREICLLMEDEATHKIGREHYLNDNGFYQGEQNAFQLVLDLLKKVEIASDVDIHKEQKLITVERQLETVNRQLENMFLAMKAAMMTIPNVLKGAQDLLQDIKGGNKE